MCTRSALLFVSAKLRILMILASILGVAPTNVGSIGFLSFPSVLNPSCLSINPSCRNIEDTSTTDMRLYVDTERHTSACTRKSRLASLCCRLKRPSHGSETSRKSSAAPHRGESRPLQPAQRSAVAPVAERGTAPERLQWAASPDAILDVFERSLPCLLRS